MSKIISHPIAKYNNEKFELIFPCQNNFFKVPTNVKISTAIKIFVPVFIKVTKHTGAYEPKMR